MCRGVSEVKKKMKLGGYVTVVSFFLALFLLDDVHPMMEGKEEERRQATSKLREASIRVSKDNQRKKCVFVYYGVRSFKVKIDSASIIALLPPQTKEDLH